MRTTGIKWWVVSLALLPALAGILLWCAGWICGLVFGVFNDGLTRGWSYINGGGRYQAFRSVYSLLKTRSN